MPLGSEGSHWLLYALVFITTLTGWFFASFRGWHISFLFAVPLPMLTNSDATVGRVIGGWHQIAEWGLLITIVIHVAAVLIHLFLIRDRVMQRMLPLARTFRS
ncbi:MAG: cytochrome b/b6 domain-containing protein [Alphaproteobacteria bacterium]|nr:cytochrome b/b6 domain-containing protein [Alphaproteobacteria bacterium]